MFPHILRNHTAAPAGLLNGFCLQGEYPPDPLKRQKHTLSYPDILQNISILPLDADYKYIKIKPWQPLNQLTERTTYE